MAIHILERIYTVTVTLATTALMSVRIPVNGVLEEVEVYIATANVSSTPYLNGVLNGVALWTGEDRLKILPGTTYVSKSGLAINVLDGDNFVLDVNDAGARLTAPIVLILRVNDGKDVQEIVVAATASLADLAESNLSTALGKTSQIHSLALSVNSRFRLYQTSAARTADAARPIGTDPTDNAGLICEVVKTASLPGPFNFSYVPIGVNHDAVRVSNLYAAIQNRSGGASIVTATIKVLKLEE